MQTNKKQQRINEAHTCEKRNSTLNIRIHNVVFIQFKSLLKFDAKINKSNSSLLFLSNEQQRKYTYTKIFVRIAFDTKLNS